MQLLSIQVGRPQALGHAGAALWPDRPWTTGFFKVPVAGPVWLGRENLAGDGQADLRHHGGPEKAVNAYPSEHYPYWAAELGALELPRPAFGENFTTAGLLEAEVCIGDVFELGTALMQLSQPRQPCWKLGRRWRIPDLAWRVQQSGRTGWYFRVLREGEVEAGQTFQLHERPHPQWTVAAANEVMHLRQHDLAAARALADCPALATSWRESLERRAATGHISDSSARLEDPG
ncbi:MAG: MOSC domain-containing protein [Gammaproteobacteria bacterium]|nr:MAG: MOSC domain-containing protein [Gammaproteobacteria bacterium]